MEYKFVPWFGLSSASVFRVNGPLIFTRRVGFCLQNMLISPSHSPCPNTTREIYLQLSDQRFWIKTLAELDHHIEYRVNIVKHDLRGIISGPIIASPINFVCFISRPLKRNQTDHRCYKLKCVYFFSIHQPKLPPYFPSTPVSSLVCGSVISNRSLNLRYYPRRKRPSYV